MRCCGGMELKSDGSCSTPNWITSVVAIPLILRTQISLRQMDTNWAGILPSVLIILSLIVAYEIVVGGDGPFSPRAVLHYFQTRECSIPSPIENNSPLWGGLNMPFFCFIIYMSAVLPPMFMTGRYLECAVYVAILSFAFTFPDAWASKFCSLSCSIGIRYLFWSGPALHPRAEIIRTGQPSKQTGMFKNLMRAYSTFCFGTAKLE